MSTRIAAGIQENAIGNIRGIGNLGLEDSAGPNPFALVNRILSVAVGIITVVAGLWFLFLVFSGALSLVTSGGDKAVLESAKKKLSSGLIGLIVTVTAIFIADIVGQILGFRFLEVGEFFTNVWFDLIT
jgi:hypothetical protein